MNSHFALFALAIAAIVLAGCVAEEQPPLPPNSTQMTQKLCDASSGRWNACGTPEACRDPRTDRVCKQECTQYCECGTVKNFRCPAGYICTDKVPTIDGKDTIGLCKPAP